jgi:uncharacterized SAM-binding protein YcdF (DUF218 family)
MAGRPSYREVGGIRGRWHNRYVAGQVLLTVEPSGRGTGVLSSRARARGRRPKVCWVVAGLVVALLLSLSARLFVWPAQNAVQGLHADAVVVFNGSGPRWQVALELAREHAAPVMLVSVASVQWNCPPDNLPGVQVECFRPDPLDTRGEARFAASEAHAHGWHSLIVVTSVAQATRARVRVRRCFGGQVYVVVAKPAFGTWAYEVAYEWGALAKALVLQPGC